MKLLISPKNAEEAKEAVTGGADIVDVKNPLEGSLGANFPWIIREIKEMIPEGVEISATIGDFPPLPGTASLAALGMCTLGVDYIKVGLKVQNYDDSLRVAQSVVRAVKEYNSDTKVVIAGYADFPSAGTVDCMEIPEISHISGADFAMLDTFIKDGKTLFDHLSFDSIRKFTVNSHELGLGAAFGGSIKKDHISSLYAAGADVIGIRGAVCGGGDRMAGKIKSELVSQIKQLIVNLK